MQIYFLAYVNFSPQGKRIDGQSFPIHHSMEALPLSNGCKFSSDIKYKSQSISCFSDRSLAPYSSSGKCMSLFCKIKFIVYRVYSFLYIKCSPLILSIKTLKSLIFYIIILIFAWIFFSMFINALDEKKKKNLFFCF